MQKKISFKEDIKVAEKPQSYALEFEIEKASSRYEQNVVNMGP
jgi:hypothetical protein